ncbi:MAG TPA: sulfur oxidation c-type cytochrome SoxA [Usitatibacter sp.]|nr:sulfur oxidation c-type cytochrome SoxA [Usitatibacter sp.]
MRRASIVPLLFIAASFAAAGQELPARPHPLRNGSAFQGPDVRELQSDDFANPMSLWISRGEAVWKEPRGSARMACAACHGDAATSMKGVAARYPRYDPALGRVVNVEERIQACSVGAQGAARFGDQSDELVGLSAYIARQSRGMPLSVSIDGPAHAAWEKGRELYFTRIGQMNLACTQCHDANWGRRLYAETISQGHPTGWPAYRNEWQHPGTLERRLRACFFGVRAELPPYGDPDMIALELYIAWRAQGLPLEAPGVRR